MARTRKAMVAKVGGPEFNALHEEAAAFDVLFENYKREANVEVVDEVEKYLGEKYAKPAKKAAKKSKAPKAKAEKRPGWSAVAKKAWVTRRANLGLAA